MKTIKLTKEEIGSIEKKLQNIYRQYCIIQVPGMDCAIREVACRMAKIISAGKKIQKDSTRISEEEASNGLNVSQRIAQKMIEQQQQQREYDRQFRVMFAGNEDDTLTTLDDNEIENSVLNEPSESVGLSGTTTATTIDPGTTINMGHTHEIPEAISALPEISEEPGEELEEPDEELRGLRRWVGGYN